MSVGKNDQRDFLEVLELLKIIDGDVIKILFEVIENFIISGDLLFHETSEGFLTLINEEKIENFKKKYNKKYYDYLSNDNITNFFALMVHYISDKAETPIYKLFQDIDIQKSKSFVENTKLIENLIFENKTILNYLLNVIFNNLNKVLDIDYNLPIKTLEFKRESEKRNIINSECELSLNIFNKGKNRSENLTFSLTYHQIKLFREKLEQIEKDFTSKEEIIKEIEKKMKGNDGNESKSYKKEGIY